MSKSLTYGLDISISKNGAKIRRMSIIARGGVVFIEDNNGMKQRYPPKDSIFANPFKVGRDGDRKNVIWKYQEYIEERLLSREITNEDISNLRGKNLGCWCKPDRCHGDVLLKILDQGQSKLSPEGYLLDKEGYVVVKFM